MLDPRTGEVLALASTPFYDASAIANPATEDDGFAAVRDDPDQPLLDAADAGPLRARLGVQDRDRVAGLGSGAIDADDDISRSRPRPSGTGLVVNGFRINEHAGVPARTFDLAGATEVSSNIWFALAGLETGGDNLVEYAEQHGLRRPAAVRPADGRRPRSPSGGGSAPGGFEDDDGARQRLLRPGARRFVTPLQMALVAATVANDGELMRPRLVTALTGKEGTRRIGPESLERVISAADAAAITAAMVEAVEGDLGRQFTRRREGARASPPRASPAPRSLVAQASRTRGSSASRRPRPADRDRRPRRARRSGRGAGGAARGLAHDGIFRYAGTEDERPDAAVSPSRTGRMTTPATTPSA